jgi:hypothetical protein
VGERIPAVVLLALAGCLEVPAEERCEVVLTFDEPGAGTFVGFNTDRRGDVGSCEARDGHLVIDTGAAAVHCAFHGDAVVELTDRRWQMSLPDPGTGVRRYDVRFEDPEPGSERHALVRREATTLGLRLCENEGCTGAPGGTATFVEGSQAAIAVRIEDGDVVGEWAPAADGPWTVFARTPFPLTAARLGFGVNDQDAVETAADHIELADVRFCPR